MSYRIPLFDLNFDEAEERAVLEVLRSRWISMGPQTAALEEEFARHVGARHAIAVNSCTAALHLSLVACGIGQGDEVIVPSLTFVATVNAVGYVGATPIFADIVSHDDFSIDPEHVRQLVGPRTRAIIAMHYAGFACNMTALSAIAHEHGLRLIEDAAHAPASRWDGRAVGTFGDAGCFSFFSNKNITCAEGGMIVTNDDKIAEQVRLMRSHGMTTLSYDRAKGHATRYDVIARGFNYRLDDIRAAIARAQLNKMPDDISRRTSLRRLFTERLDPVEGLRIPYRSLTQAASHYVFPVLLCGGGPDVRDGVRAELAERGIETSVHYPAVHRFSIYAGACPRLERTEHVADHVISLPFFGNLSDEQVAYVTDCLTKAVDSHGIAIRTLPRNS